MENNAMMLLMTDKGMQRMRELIAQGSEISLFIALGSGQKKPSKATTTLSEKQEEGKITLLSTINPKENSWHINAHFSPTDLEYDITEIGLFINDIKKLQADTLWGIYFSESAIAKKTRKVDLLLDIIVTLKDLDADNQIIIKGPELQPRFSIPHATSDTYGAVKFASKMDIKAKTPGLALSTSHLDALIDLDEAKLKFLKELDIVKFKELIDSNKDQNTGKFCEVIYTTDLSITSNFLLMGLFFRKNIIYGLFMEVENDGLGKRFKRITYSIEANTIDNKEDSLTLEENFVYLPSVSNGYDQNHLNCLAFKDYNISQNTVWKLEFPISGSDKINHKQLANFENKETGSLLFYNENFCIIGSIKEKSNKLLLGNDIDKENNFAIQLAYPRKKPLVHVIQEKIYCLGGSADQHPILEVHTFDIKNKKVNHSCFIPENTAPFNLIDTTEYTSCVLDHYIYVLKPSAYYKESIDRYFYVYDFYNNVWQSIRLPDQLFEKHNMKPKAGQAVSDGKAIYLFCTEEKESKTQLFIIKFRPN